MDSLVGLNLLEQRANEWFLDTYRPGGSTIFAAASLIAKATRLAALLPRWTTGSGILDVHPAASGPVSVTLRLADHRPPDLPRASLTLLVNDSAITPLVASAASQPVSTDYSFYFPTWPAPQSRFRRTHGIDPNTRPVGAMKFVLCCKA